MGETFGKDGGGGKRTGARGQRVRRPGARSGPMGGVRPAAPREAAASPDAPASAPAKAGAGKPRATSAAASKPAGKPASAKSPRGQAEAKRRGVGFLQVGSLTAAPVREASARRGFAETRILFDWVAIAGETLSAHCRPLKIGYSSAAFGATLVLEVEGARAAEVEMQGPRIIERVNAHYGYRAISRVRIVQAGRLSAAARDAAPGFAEGPSGFERRAAADDAPAPADVAEVEDEGLRAALARLGRRVRAAQEEG
ncbi:DUF721 domain-containing protein [Albimonas sp. CAU 1670]|uniref:DUF721 domain-containing protein n=1 Tax=Albimonas sp. CAU 1670 TaxID=3032599 RepID=UPI0023D9DF89|nr:DUF721 domain-containing protein [Albimonas sp. CAU 1670]MDF2234924.1 DUF721 domain-containing protein [Albimonas sp. CAU 1670]